MLIAKAWGSNHMHDMQKAKEFFSKRPGVEMAGTAGAFLP